MAQDQLRNPQPTRGTRGGAFAYCGSHLSPAEPEFTPLYRSRYPCTPQSATKPFATENSPDHLNYYGDFHVVRLIRFPHYVPERIRRRNPFLERFYFAALRCQVTS